MLDSFHHKQNTQYSYGCCILLFGENMLIIADSGEFLTEIHIFFAANHKINNGNLNSLPLISIVFFYPLTGYDMESMRPYNPQMNFLNLVAKVCSPNCSEDVIMCLFHNFNFF